MNPFKCFIYEKVLCFSVFSPRYPNQENSPFNSFTFFSYKKMLIMALSVVKNHCSSSGKLYFKFHMLRATPLCFPV